MPLPITELRQSTLTAVVEDIKPPLTFLKGLLYSREETLTTETVQIETKARGRTIAPFIRQNGEAIMVERTGASGYVVSAPNIRLKMPLTPSELLYNREPGGLVFSPSAANKAGQLQRQIAEDLEVMNDMIVNAEEYMSAMALQGTISYEVADEEVFTITYSRPAANNITLSTFWDDATPADVRILTNFETAKRVVADDGSPAVTDVILGSEAHDQLIELVQQADATNPIRALISRDSGVDVGALTFIQRYTDGGAIYVGQLAGLRIWAYRATATLNGSTVNMVRPKYAEFVSTSQASQRVMYYGAIPDMRALRGRLFVGRRFSKSWENEDPSAYFGLVHSRPLPVPRRPGATVSMKVISG